MADLDHSLIKKVRAFLEERKCKNTLEYWESLPDKEKVSWIESICKTQRRKATDRPDRRDIKRFRKHRDEQLRIIKNAIQNDYWDEDKFNELFFKEISNDHLKKSFRLLDEFLDPEKFRNIDDKIFTTGWESLAGYDVDESHDTFDRKEQLEKEIAQLEALEESRSHWNDICQIVTQIKKPKESNASRLHVAKKWLPDMIKDIVSIEEPTHEDVLKRIQQDFPDFDKVQDEPNLKFTKGLNNINKTSIDKALTYLFNKNHEGKVKQGAIKKRATKLNWWKK